MKMPHRPGSHAHAHDHHDHSHSHSHIHAAGGEGQGRERKLLIAFVLTTVMMVAEVFGGFWSGSLALLADAGHMMVDSLALLLAVFGAWFAK
ncbi:cation transporter, partial [Dyella silvatica]|uniref:cation transporter n=1 Tax=Dyella silvatica TaxID=2992128 RepID=UPI002257D119